MFPESHDFMYKTQKFPSKPTTKQKSYPPEIRLA